MYVGVQARQAMNQKWGPNPGGSDQSDLHDVVICSKAILVLAIPIRFGSEFLFSVVQLRTVMFAHQLTQASPRGQRTGATCAGGSQRSTYVPRAQAVLKGPPGQIAVKKAAIESVSRAGSIHRAHSYRFRPDNGTVPNRQGSVGAELNHWHMHAASQFPGGRFHCLFAGHGPRFQFIWKYELEFAKQGRKTARLKHVWIPSQIGGNRQSS